MVKIKSDLLYDVSASRQIKHVALTGYLSRKWRRCHNFLCSIVLKCDVAPYLGALPPELRKRVGQKNLSEVTLAFRNVLKDFLIQNACEIYSMDKDRVYKIPEIACLFRTSCELEAKGKNAYGYNPWSGISGFVVKLSFPEINAHYALKLFYKNRPKWIEYDHGVWFEVATAFAANKAEPKDNNPIYMASLISEKYMLSAWAGEEDGIKERENKNTIFITSPHETCPRNLRAGRRIDWGETYLTDYGAMSYRARKIFRQIMACDGVALRKSCDIACDGIAKKELERALRVADLTAYFEHNIAVQNFLSDFLQR